MATDKHRTGNLLIRIVMVLLMVLGTGVTAVATASPALAACSGSGCLGKDPNAQGCSASNIASTEMWYSSFSVAMRNSSGCRARWTRIVVDDYLPTCCSAIGIAIEVEQYYQGRGWGPLYFYSKKVGAGLEGNYWTAMVPNNIAETRTRSCWRFQAQDDSSYGSYTCSGWVS